ncbi:hypothetical protein [Streptomyces sp. DW26H14]|uniref:hypothetical protein n=1 Tax=Streptomyces sp. DW26H14 TaxID=3435395 RepID=UPI00403D9046
MSSEARRRLAVLIERFGTDGSLSLATHDPMPEPKPAPGCDVCAACHRQWQQAVDRLSPAHDRSHAADLAEEIRRHPHSRAARMRGAG